MVINLRRLSNAKSTLVVVLFNAQLGDKVVHSFLNFEFAYDNDKVHHFSHYVKETPYGAVVCMLVIYRPKYYSIFYLHSVL